ncbi:succinate-semialdehyde dehydrogenase (NADP(+)) [Aliidiomarina shirensis]|uniref:Succinate-semialdehyde dehydrogenase (NADP(+)) n=1 Tax=Aliidiomarina shirensis TaxID=1048642 RepID=A0A432WV21_9GAMM|nr:NAD-dependent succinate-semialdehyde dehydrogenase [Aliidiomarina shirensis]RUO37616.1 succinate-semialdehyde dehydrogenase (NADP(+)) [Aliidiomarina shirensis]
MPISEATRALIYDRCYVGGEWVASDSNESFAVTNPADGSEIAQVPAFGSAETERAIQAAHDALPAWRQKTAAERATILKKWHALVMEKQQELGELMTLEQGKPVAEAKGEIAYAASYIEWFAEEARRVYGETIPGLQTSQRIIVTREPVGVCVAITPWNFPAAMITRKVAPALAVGCTIVVKPASETPLTALALAALAAEAGVPAGVFSVVTGSAKAIGKVFTESELVRKLSFTGSTAIGSLLMEACAPSVKRVSLELGGNAPFLVFDDADIEAAVQGVMDSKFRNAGQTCVCANRIYVQKGVYADFVEKLTKKVEALKVGNGFDEGVVIGPLISESAVEKVEEHIADALAHGGRIVCGGSRHELGGTWFTPTVIADGTQKMLCTREETFGPVAPIIAFDTEEQGIEFANATEFGLAAYFYSRDLGRVRRVSEGIEAGMIGINTGLISNATAPFGGIKASGLGREGARQGIDEYSEFKYLCIDS